MKMCMLALTTAIVVAACGVQGCSGARDTSGNRSSDKASDTKVNDTAGKIPVSSVAAKGILRLIPRRTAGSRLVASDPSFTITGYSDSSVSLFFTLTGGGYDLSMVRATFYGAGDRSLAVAQTSDIATSGTMNAETGTPSLTTYGRINFAPSSRPAATGVKVVVEFLTATDEAVWVIDVEPADTSASDDRTSQGTFEFTLVTDQSEGRVAFDLRVRRIGVGRPGEYMPTAERCRFQVFNADGAELWNSSANVMFAQVIGEVEPVALGSTSRYRAVWDVEKSTTVGTVPHGRYTMRITIPARPLPYFHTEEFIYGEQ